MEYADPRYNRTMQSVVFRRGFTLIELLLVVVIAGLIAGLAIPRFVQSFKGQRLRDAVRTVVRVHRYARSSSVLNQQDGALLFDIEKNTLTLVALPRASDAGAQAGFLDGMRQGDSIFSDEDEDLEVLGEEEEAEQVQIEERLERALAKGVQIVEFESDFASQEIDGIYWVNYHANGMCDPFTVRLAGPKKERHARIEVDSVSGQVEVEYE